jgi:hypothetical protein
MRISSFFDVQIFLLSTLFCSVSDLVFNKFMFCYFFAVCEISYALLSLSAM